MNWKLIVLGGLAYFVATFAVSMITGQIIHTGILDSAYDMTAAFWRPELNQDPPDMVPLMPMWIMNGLIASFVAAVLYNWVRPAFGGAGWMKGLSFGIVLALFTATYHLGLSGVFNLPMNIWFWWTVDVVVIFAIGGAVLGLVAEKVAPQAA